MFSEKLKTAMAVLSLLACSQALAQSNLLTLSDAVNRAQSSDPWLDGNRYKQQATEAMSVAAGSMPDPKVSLTMANLATDSLDFNQEAMTQLKVGVAQMIPRGDSLALASKQLEQQGAQYPFLRQDRRGKVAVTVAGLWFDVYKAQQSIALIERDRALFEQLTDVAQAQYSSALGKTRQQDIVRAQLELTRLEDRLTKLQQQRQVYSERLGEWLGDAIEVTLPTQLPTINAKGDQMPNFSRHPAMMALDQRIKAGQSGIALAKQQYKPQWTLNASYGYRGDMPNGGARADLFSVGIAFDIPISTGDRQDQWVNAAVARRESVKTDKALLLRRFQSGYRSEKAQLDRLEQRERLYRDKLLKQSSEQAEAALTAYTNDEGDFAEVVRARIAQLNAQIDLLAILVDKAKAQVRINYFSITSDAEGVL